MGEEHKDRRILIVDDQQLFAETLRRALVYEGFSRVAYETSASESGIYQKSASFKPDLILMDIHLNELDGFSLSEEILTKHPNTIIIMLTAFGYEDYIHKAMAIGASGILLKDVSIAELIKSITMAEKGDFIITNFNTIASKTRNSGQRPDWFNNLSERNQEILRMIAQGFSNDEIAQALHLGKQTVKNYISRLYAEMQVTNRFQAIRTILEVMPEYSHK
ncbi:MAG: response regulator transcription factor [Spirochaetia bacterium]|nr:response regulator transcription factor [Spirochaetia bacterium]